MNKATASAPAQSSEPQHVEGDNSAVLSKFESVWRVIFEVKQQISDIVCAGKSHINFGQAVDMLQTIQPILSELRDHFDRCLSFSPLVLDKSKPDFTKLSTSLNTFFQCAGLSGTDPSLPVSSQQLIGYFHISKNRVMLMTGLEQLTELIRDYNSLSQQIS
ncbi:uncharacterized protein LOC131951770 [Physella acuta]|uniref:uncharacterized protein LOC131951770 n=1 Tax=Physella acuta TaxID=109671 RepID=UPI0027DCAD2B|nr:uncharacterized protein LOC131951770 [Physella acuta]